MSERQSQRLFTGLMLFVLSYEWIVSGVDKILNHGFVAGLQQQFSDALSAGLQYGFYRYLVKNYFVPNSELLAYTVEIGELAIGVAFVLLAVYVLRGKMTKTQYMVGLVTGIIAALVSLNFFFYQGGSFFFNPGDPYDAGIPIDFILVLANAAIAVWSYVSLTARPNLVIVAKNAPPNHKNNKNNKNKNVTRKAASK